MSVYKWIILCVVVAALLLLVYKMLAQPPSKNTPEYLERHGILPGKPADVVVGETRFLVPQTFSVNVLSSRDIVPGRADVLTVYFDYLNDDFVTGIARASDRRVRVELRSALGKKENVIPPDNWQNIIARDAIGLVEYHSKNIKAGWGSVVFSPVDSTFVGPNGQALRFNCLANEKKEFDLCWLSLLYANKIDAWVFIPAPLLPHWQHIYTHINQRLNSFMME